MLQKFQDHISNNFSFLKNSRLLIAISGGLDSVVLTHLCMYSGLDFELAHCNFNLRGAESDGDEKFTGDFANSQGLEFHLRQFNTETYAKTKKISLQMAARDLRYQWFDELLDEYELDYVLTAHHLDDNLETVLINVSRGTGLEGLKGIPEINGKIVRPLLIFSREEIMQFAQEKKLKWREDSSNLSDKYLRNDIRLNVIPELKKTNPELLKNFQSTIEHVKSAVNVLKERIELIRTEVLIQTEDGYTIEIDKLKQHEPLSEILYQLFKPFGFTAWNDIYDLLEAQSGKQVFSKEWRLLKNRDHLILTRVESPSDFYLEINEIGSSFNTNLGELKIEEVSEMHTSNSNCVYVDRSKLAFPLTIRNWKEGDRLFPFGMEGSKKISKYLKDEKVSLIEKDKVLVLCSNDEIVWLLGKRLDRRFSVDDETIQILKISLD